MFEGISTPQDLRAFEGPLNVLSDNFGGRHQVAHGSRSFPHHRSVRHTIYAAGCLAIRFKILPYTEADVLRSLLICQRDHVALIDRELGADE
jgi:hypothetical protein